MGTLKWYKRDPRAALIGMMGLTLEECGAYNKILDLIYIQDGAVADDADYLCRTLNCDLRTWKRIKARLLELGKVYVHAGCLRNERADEEIPNAVEKIKTKRRSSLERWATYRNIKGLPNAYGVITTSRKKESLSAKIVPMAKRLSDEEEG